jgi:hypothetical protein
MNEYIDLKVEFKIIYKIGILLFLESTNIFNITDKGFLNKNN